MGKFADFSGSDTSRTSTSGIAPYAQVIGLIWTYLNKLKNTKTKLGGSVDLSGKWSGPFDVAQEKRAEMAETIALSYMTQSVTNQL